MIFFMGAILNADGRRAIMVMPQLPLLVTILSKDKATTMPIFRTAQLNDRALGMTNGRIWSILKAKWLVGF